VVGDDGKTLAATVTANSAGKSPASGHAVSAADGTFTLSSLPAGTYTLCAAVQGRGYLNPCTWSPNPPTVTVTAGQTVKGYRLTVTKGTVVQVHLNDTGGALTVVAAANQTAPHVLLGVMTDRHLFEPLVMTGKDATGQDHEGTIPLIGPAHLVVSGNGVQVTDAIGTSLAPAGSAVTVQPGAGGTPTKVIFTLTAPKP
jgi:hypothetical protein